MIGIVGVIQISYMYKGNNYTESINPLSCSVFPLSACEDVRFKIDEVSYIEDTVYGVVLLLDAPGVLDEEYLIDGGDTAFTVPALGIYGSIKLTIC